MDENIIKINLVETADKLATGHLVTKYEVGDEVDLMEESTEESGVFIWKDSIQDEYNEMYDYYYDSLLELEVVEV